jgi:hypothetical protein
VEIDTIKPKYPQRRGRERADEAEGGNENNRVDSEDAEGDENELPPELPLDLSVAVMVVPGVRYDRDGIKYGGWSSGEFECFSNMFPTAFTSFFCAFVVFGQITHKAFRGSCVLWGALFAVFFVMNLYYHGEAIYLFANALAEKERSSRPKDEAELSGSSDGVSEAEKPWAKWNKDLELRCDLTTCAACVLG